MSDLATSGTGACIVNLRAATGLWATGAVFAFASFVNAAVFMHGRYARLRVVAPGSGTYKSDAVALRIGASATAASLCTIVVCALRASDPASRVIGLDPLTTTLFSLCMSFVLFTYVVSFMRVITMFLDVSLQKLLSGRLAEASVRFARRWGRAVIVAMGALSAVAVLAPLLLLIDPGSASFAYAAVFLNNVLTTLVLGIASAYFVALSHELEKRIRGAMREDGSATAEAAAGRSRAALVADKLRSARSRLVMNAVPNFLLLVAFGVLPVLQQLFTFQLAVSLGFGTPLVISLVLKFLTPLGPDAASESSSRGAAAAVALAPSTETAAPSSRLEWLLCRVGRIISPRRSSLSRKPAAAGGSPARDAGAAAAATAPAADGPHCDPGVAPRRASVAVRRGLTAECGTAADE